MGRAFSIANYQLTPSNSFIYGGFFTPENSAAIDSPTDFYILSLPAFQWFRAPNSLFGSRSYHTCNAAGNNQMVILGGYDKADDTAQSQPDIWDQGINVYDMSNLEWKDKYEANADPYTPPDMVASYYSQSYVFLMHHLGTTISS